ncbi:MAG: DNA mismatch repair endonuclease MutL [Gemmataceae bacterium]
MRIHQLPTSVITKIAAGEVIERPASVIKELLENSVDAGSTRIDIEVEQGGIELMRVVDDGCGILAEDLPLAFASHATSKLDTADDLFHIGTLGFRGEALASIGGVAQVTLQSRPADQPNGAEIRCHGGELSEVRPWNGAAGTRIEVRHLFFNTPVRRKFLRTIGTEMGHICEIFTRLSLAYSDLHLTLRHNNKNVYEVKARTPLLDRVGLFFGDEVRDQLYHIDATAGPLRLHGFIGDPGCERGTAKQQYLFLNGRWIRDRGLGHAIQEGYRGLLMTGRYAVAFLFLDMPPELIDVNVHPTKAEVRFRDSQSVYHLILTSIRKRLAAENLTARLQVPSSLSKPQPTAPLPDKSLLPDPPPWSLTPSPAPAPPLPFAASTNSDKSSPMSADDSEPPLILGQETAPSTADNDPPAPARPDLFAEPLKAIQLYDAYLVLETPEGMLVIDQHALHERILFEQLKKRIRSGPLEAQRLLIPEPVELSADQVALVLEQRDALAELGLGIDDFGGGTVLVTSYPALLGRRSPRDILKAVVDHLVTKDRVPEREQLLNDLLSLMACHAAVRAGDPLTPEEIATLVAMRHLAADNHHCPHGRPTSLLFSRHDLDRQFRRI